MTDYTKLSDEDFQKECAALYAEQDRRTRLASIPADIKKMADDFAALGGDRSDLVDQINTEE